MNKTKLIRMLAEEVMEWEIRNIYPEADETYHFGWRWYEKGEKNFIRSVENWNPLEDWNDCMMLVEQAQDIWFRIEWLAGLYKATFSKPNVKAADQTYHEHTSASLKEAICIAAAKAVGISIED